MASSSVHQATPRDSDLGLRSVRSASGLSAIILPNGALFSLGHEEGGRRIEIGLVLGSPHHGSIGRILVRTGGPRPRLVEAVGPSAQVSCGVSEDAIVWGGETDGIRHSVALRLHPVEPIWFWRVEVEGEPGTPCDIVLVQDVGLGDRGFLMGNEAFASQYLDHEIRRDPGLGLVVMSRQNLVQRGGHPWAMQGCLDGAAHAATDALQLFGPAFRDRQGLDLPFGRDLPDQRLQHEAACVCLQSGTRTLGAGAACGWTFFGLFVGDHPAASGDEDLGRLAAVRRAVADLPTASPAVAPVARSLFQDAAPLAVLPLDHAFIRREFPERMIEERREGELLSFFTPAGHQNRHVVLKAKEQRVARRHGTLLRSGSSLALDDDTLCATAWMHGVFAAQLTIGNTSFHKLFSVSRDPYNITRASGLRILVEVEGRWRLLATPSAFDMGLGDCRWIYRLAEGALTVRAAASDGDPAMVWEIASEVPRRFLVSGHLVLGEREYEQNGPVAIDAARGRASFRPAADGLWARHYPDAVYHLVVPDPEQLEAMGGDELLFADGVSRGGGLIVIRTGAVSAFSFAVTGSMTDPEAAERRAQGLAAGVAAETLVGRSAGHWSRWTRDLRLSASGERAADVAAISATLPWLAHNVLMHFTVPHGLEQYSGAAWGTRDVCQGPVEYLLALEHDEPVRDILRIVFAQQYEKRGDWPQWFMLEPYSAIQDSHAHGDVIVWPLKALCDYVETTGDLGFLEESVAWRREDDFLTTARRSTVLEHVEKLLATVTERFVPGTSLLRYGEGDWNDSLQPADPSLRDRMVSSWTVALLCQQVRRYAAILRRAGQDAAAARLDRLAEDMLSDLNRLLIRDGTLAGYAIFGEGEPDLLLHPSDRRTGLRYSLLPMKRCIIAGLFDEEQTRHHRAIIAEHLACPDGVRLMDRPVAYHGGLETIFRRAESAAFFGREIGLMYVHAHLRYGDAMAVEGDADRLWEVLAIANPVAVTEQLAQAGLRQRNAYFSSSDAAFADRYAASRDWGLVKEGGVAVEGGWRIYSSGPGLYTGLLVRRALGLTRWYGERVVSPLLPSGLDAITVDVTLGEGPVTHRLVPRRR